MRKEDLAPYFGSKEDILKMFPKQQQQGKRKKERYIYVDNGAPFLLVAHIDTIQTPRLDRVNRGAGFDDRLGVYLGHKLVRERPDLFDLLLTDYEESCGSTASYFTPSHDYNLVIELDREGEDYVDYGLASDKLHDAMKASGFKKGLGSFTDICMMDHVKCNKINVGLGTKGSHSMHSRFDMNVFYRQTKRLLDFVELHRDTKWPEVVGGKWEGWFDRDRNTDCCDLCLAPAPFSKLIYDRRRDCWVCSSCANIPGDEMGASGEIRYLECESCGDPHSIDELVYDPLYDGFLCASCHYILHSDDHEDAVLEGI